MQPTNRLFDSLFKTVLLLIGIMLISGCTYQRRYKSGPIEPPQEIYLAPAFQPIQNPRILITRFKAPEYAGDVGAQAAFALFSELQMHHPETELAIETRFDDSDHEKLFAYARANRFDLVICGNVLFLLDGGISTASQMEEIVRVFTVWGDGLNLAAYAKALETGPPVPELDLFIVRGQGRNAPSAASLLKRNAVKFSRVISGLISGEK